MLAHALQRPSHLALPPPQRPRPRRLGCLSLARQPRPNHRRADLGAPTRPQSRADVAKGRRVMAQSRVPTRVSFVVLNAPLERTLSLGPFSVEPINPLAHISRA